MHSKLGGLMLCVIALIAAQTALADGSSKPHGVGGRFSVYFPIIKQYNKSGERFRIEGFCRSACTLFLSIKTVCIERSAFLSFHAGPDAKTGKWGPKASSTKTMLAAYKPALRKYLVEGHHVDSRAYFTMKGAALIDRFGYAECPAPMPPLPARRDHF